MTPYQVSFIVIMKPIPAPSSGASLTKGGVVGGADEVGANAFRRRRYNIIPIIQFISVLCYNISFYVIIYRFML